MLHFSAVKCIWLVDKGIDPTRRGRNSPRLELIAPLNKVQIPRLEDVPVFPPAYLLQCSPCLSCKVPGESTEDSIMPLFLVTPVPPAVRVSAISGEIVQDALCLVEHFVLFPLFFFVFPVFPMDGKPTQDPDHHGEGGEYYFCCDRCADAKQYPERHEHKNKGCKPSQEDHSIHFSVIPAAISFVCRPIDEDGCGLQSALHRHDSSIQA